MQIEQQHLLCALASQADGLIGQMFKQNGDADPAARKQKPRAMRSSVCRASVARGVKQGKISASRMRSTKRYCRLKSSPTA